MFEKKGSVVVRHSAKVSAYFVMNGSFIEEETFVLTMLDAFFYMCVQADFSCTSSDMLWIFFISLH